MNIESLRALRGPNLWSDETVLEAILVIEKAEADLAAFSRLCGLLPRGMAEELFHGFGSPDTTSFWARVTARLTLGLQAAAGCDVGYWSSKEFKAGSEYRIVAQYTEEQTGRRALALCLELCAAAREARSVDVAAEIVALRKLNEDVRLGPSTGCIVRAAEGRNIPVRRLTEGSLVQFGQGSRMRRIWAAETDRTSAVAESIAQDKELTKSLLDTIGVPVPKGVPAKTAEAAWAAAQEIGLPVVVKPRRGNQGRGVSVRLMSREAVLTAFTNAIPGEEEVIVERHIEGADFRLLVINGRLIAAARREPPKVVGDGARSIRELVAIENLDPRRGDDHSTSLSKMRLDEIAREILAEQGLSVDSVPEAGQVVVLRRNANLSTGGTAADVTDTVHPDVARAAIEAAQMVGLDVAGVDVVAENVEQPLEVTRGAIVEVNAAPGLRMHVEPSSGKGRPVGAAIVDSMFAPGDDARIPVVAVTGTNGKTTTTRCIAHLLRQRGLRVGMTCTDGIYVEGRRIDTGDCSGPKSARTVLAHPRVDAAVLETARGGMLREGLGFDWCDVAVVTNVGEGDHLGMNGIHTAEELAKVKAIPVRRVSERGAAVLNADDPLTVAMASLCRGAVIFFSRNPDAPKLVSHRAAGGKAVTVRDGYIVICSGKDEKRVAHVEQVPLTLGGRIGFQVENLLASVAAGFWLGLSVEALRFGIQTFSSDLGTTPGRFNVLTHRDATVILDYGHNASALLALNEAISKMPHRRRKVVYTAAGDRRDEDIDRQAEIIGSFFDDIYIYEDQCTRGRADGEIIRMMREGFTRAKRPPRRVLQKSGELAAIAAAISSLEPGDLLLCQVDQVDVALDFVKGLFRQAEARPVVPIAHFAAAALAALGIIGG
ncbi:MAG TPA: cyanophycin synthetase [Polyangiaceae bacterium]|jgi:cyanophycin synthetase|nr:cyanophycin synthetase [Polyangiaceae bacterium]